MLVRFKVDDEDAVRPCWDFIHWGVAYGSICVANEEKIQGVFLCLCFMNWEILKYELASFILKHSHMRKIFKILTVMIRIKQVIPIFIVDLHVADS